MVKLALVVTLFLMLRLAGAEPPVYGSYRFVEDVLLTSERGSNVKRCRRFVDSPSVGLFWGNEHEKEFVDAVAGINGVLAPTRFSLRTMFPASAAAQIKCFYVSGSADYTRIRQWYWLQTPPHEWTWDVSWDQFSRLTKGFVLMNVEGCDSDTVRYRTTRALLGTLGLNGWSGEVKDSIFSGQRRVLTPMDRQLIIFFYSHVRPDAQAWELRNTFDQFWSK